MRLGGGRGRTRLRGPYFTLRCPRKHQPERRVVLTILKELAYNDWACGKVKVQGSPKQGGGFLYDPYMMRGLPDIFAFKGSVMLGIECKAGANKQTPYQCAFQKYFHHPPYRLYILARSWEDVAKAIPS